MSRSLALAAFILLAIGALSPFIGAGVAGTAPTAAIITLR